MINGKRILAIIPARGGSKTIPRKNIKILAGKPLLAWTIEEAHQSKYIDRLILSSEDAEIIEVAQAWGCEVPFVRPVELARDDTPGIAPILHAIRAIEEQYDYVILLQPTSPLRIVNDIDGCISYCVQESAPACVSVCSTEASPYWMFTLNENNKLTPLMSTEKLIELRQELPSVYKLNGAVYIAKIDYLLKTKQFITEETIAYVMPDVRSWDIDKETDFIICALLKNAVPKI
jgi:N-acylneuraminate cytidylyltransferase